MKKILTTLTILWITSSVTKADVIFSPYTDFFGFAYSIEGIGSYEIAFSNHKTINFWGGIGAVGIQDYFSHPAYGGELACELRHYFQQNSYKNLVLGLYAGVASMRYPLYHRGFLKYSNTIGFVPGIKLTYKKNICTNIVSEPYLSVSTPLYKSNGFVNLVLTLGIRVGFNKVKTMIDK